MSIENSEIIDFVGIDKYGNAVLTLPHLILPFDNLDSSFREPNARLALPLL
jgi:hypothetical protein